MAVAITVILWSQPAGEILGPDSGGCWIGFMFDPTERLAAGGQRNGVAHDGA